MTKAESIQEFGWNSQTDVPLDNQFNVFDRSTFGNCRLLYNRRDFYKISFMRAGTSQFLYATRGITVDQPALVFSNPLVPYSWEATSEYQAGYFCLFSEEFLRISHRNLVLQESPLFKISNDPVFFLTPAQEQFIEYIFQCMMREASTDYVHKHDLLRHYVHVLLHEALKLQPNGTYFSHLDAASRLTNLFLELLERQFPVDSPQRPLALRTPAQYADRLAVHPNHLNAVVRKVTGKTTSVHIAERIVWEAKNLLQHTPWSVADIAYSLGYEYPTYFTNFFKKRTGLAPHAFR